MAPPPSGPDGESPHPGDSTLDLLLAEPFRILRPAVQTLPFVFASGHSGRHYPDRLIAESRLDPLTLRRSEDAFVDELFAGVAALGAPLIAASFPRAYCDVNRAASELDAAMFHPRPALPIDAPTPRVAAGLGVIPRIVRDGAEIYAIPTSMANILAFFDEAMIADGWQKPDPDTNSSRLFTKGSKKLVVIANVDGGTFSLSGQ